MASGVLPVVIAVDQGGTWLRVAVSPFISVGTSPVISQRHVRCGRAEHGANVAGDLAAIIDDALAHTAQVLDGPVRVIAGVGNNGRQVAEGWTDSNAGSAPFTSFSEATLALSPDDPNGTVLIAGTGAAVATITAGVETTVDGAVHGVCGSALWIGRQLLDHDDEAMTPSEVAWLAKEAIEQLTERPGTCPEHQKRSEVITAAADGLLDIFDMHQSRLGHPVKNLTLVGSLTNPSHVLGAALQDGFYERGVQTVFLPDLLRSASTWATAFARRFTAPNHP